MMYPRIVALVAPSAVVVAVLGCGDERPAVEPSATYSPESLAQEPSFRYRTIDRGKDGAAGDPGAITKSGVTKGGGATTK